MGGSRLTPVSIGVAPLAMASSFFHSDNHSRNLDVVQRNVIHGECLRTCRDIIDACFQTRLRTAALNDAVATMARSADPADHLARREAEASVSRFGALGTFLANFRDDALRERCTQLAAKLLAIARDTDKQPREACAKANAEAAPLFGEMNEDRARTARLAFL